MHYGICANRLLSILSARQTINNQQSSIDHVLLQASKSCVSWFLLLRRKMKHPLHYSICQNSFHDVCCPLVISKDCAFAQVPRFLFILVLDYNVLQGQKSIIPVVKIKKLHDVLHFCPSFFVAPKNHISQPMSPSSFSWKSPCPFLFYTSDSCPSLWKTRKKCIGVIMACHSKGSSSDQNKTKQNKQNKTPCFKVHRPVK